MFSRPVLQELDERLSSFFCLGKAQLVEVAIILIAQQDNGDTKLRQGSGERSIPGECLGTKDIEVLNRLATRSNTKGTAPMSAIAEESTNFTVCGGTEDGLTFIQQQRGAAGGKPAHHNSRVNARCQPGVGAYETKQSKANGLARLPFGRGDIQIGRGLCSGKAMSMQGPQHQDSELIFRAGEIPGKEPGKLREQVFGRHNRAPEAAMRLASVI